VCVCVCASTVVVSTMHYHVIAFTLFYYLSL